MIRKLFTIILLLTLCHAPAWAQTDDDFVPTLPSEPGQMARIKLSVNPEGAGRVYGGGQYYIGRQVNVYTNSSGDQWKFLCWRNGKTGEVVSNSSSFYITATYGTTSLVAEYEQLTVSPLVLECNPKEANASLNGAGYYVEGRSVYVRAYTPSSYRFVNWTNKRTGQVVSTYSYLYFTKTSSEDTLVANYDFVPNAPNEPTPAIVYRHLYADVNMSEGGSVSSSDQRVAVGTSVSVSAYNNDLYEFIGWKRDGKIVSQKSTYTLKMGTSDIKLTAMFQFAPSRPDEPEMAEEQPEPEPDPEPEPEPEPEPLEPSTILGDVNGDYRVNIIDLTMINGYILGREVEGFVFSNADINKDGRVNALDVALLIARLIINV